MAAHRAKSTLRSGQAVPATLHLNLHREYFTQIAAGTKRIKYRSHTPYWRRRLAGRYYGLIQFRNGYATRAPEMQAEFGGVRARYRTLEWAQGQPLAVTATGIPPCR